MNLEKRGDLYALVLFSAVGLGSNAPVAKTFLRNVEPQGIAETTGLFCALKRLFLLMSHLSGA